MHYCATDMGDRNNVHTKFVQKLAGPVKTAPLKSYVHTLSWFFFYCGGGSEKGFEDLFGSSGVL